MTLSTNAPYTLPCASLALLAEDLSAASRRSKNHRGTLTICEEKYLAFARRMDIFFDLIAAAIPSSSAWHCNFWGLICAVFKAAGTYVIVFEKVTELLESVTHLMPDYKQLLAARTRPLDLEERRGSETYFEPVLHVVTDVAQFLRELQEMLTRTSHGDPLRHNRLFSPTYLWRPLDSRFAQLEARLVRNKEWLEKELGGTETEYAITEKYRAECREFLDKQSQAQEGEELGLQRMAKRMRRIDRIKTWLDSNCSYRDIYEHRLRQRHPNTCAWFLDNEKYCRWRNIPFDDESANDTDRLENHWQHRVLFVQAESGFGKSYLSGIVVDDLSSEAGNLSIDDETESPSTAFYHFSAAHSYCIHPDDALRALTDQLIYTHRHDRSTLDAVSLLVRKTPTHEKATPDDVLSTLALLLRQHPTFLVIDGIDECSDVELLLRYIPTLCRKSDTRVVLFGRPHVRIPNEYHKWASDAPHVISLGSGSNKHDVEAYIIENLHELADQGYFGISMDRSLITAIAQTCKGNFLWASCLLKYLRSPVLSPDERRAKLEKPHELDGLEAIYAHILALLEFRPEGERRFVVGVFRLLALGIHRPCMPGFQKAINVSPGQRTIEFGPSFTTNEAIPLLTCDLVEVTPCNVTFAHNSVREYLQAVSPDTSSFSLQDENLAHAHLAAVCISFLAFDIPKRPLGPNNPHVSQLLLSSQAQSSATSMRTINSGDSGYKSISSAPSISEHRHAAPGPSNVPASSARPPCQPQWDAALPFLRYASLCWPIHLTRALTPPLNSSSQQLQSSPSSSSQQYPWLTSLSTFLTDRAAVTTWVEASWRYNLPPNLSRLVPLLEAVKSRTPPATVEGRELRWVVHGVRELSEGLNAVREGWGHRVREDPGLVWGWRGGRGMI
ncbi:uncharacterized protein CC84DRAFT_1089035 [Paraphaeosphaeria sporulosa]|uniref:Nephrocystin 3-like N-terminal domain-containing protein n=1 Tax=Paraphaeosphaeria sporulosa TaxID=1460663 RepID=A0A177CL92_9PLEO|nr:uncharacterized protein CC84DRAFT_1089035 [Paraphaeosphaeria sporulosa]OAG07638.1 hypothetical protein CC84DRAFT_1089035 [Paraphaeosphaeria sporulosa]